MAYSPVYVEVGTTPGPVRLAVVLLGSPGPVAARRWRMRITHLNPRDAPLAAPSHCLQYHTQLVGGLQSFNFLGPGGYTVSIIIISRKENKKLCTKGM